MTIYVCEKCFTPEEFAELHEDGIDVLITHDAADCVCRGRGMEDESDSDS